MILKVMNLVIVVVVNEWLIYRLGDCFMILVVNILGKLN